MGTRVYGASDDLIEFDGDLRGEVGSYGTDDRDKGVLVAFDDGTIVEVKYCKNTSGVWGIGVLAKGAKFDRVEICADPDAEPYSDQLFLHDGVKRAWAATGVWSAVA